MFLKLHLNLRERGRVKKKEEVKQQGRRVDFLHQWTVRAKETRRPWKEGRKD